MKRWSLDAVGREHLRIVEEPRPEPKSRQVVVKVAAATLNFHDKLLIDNGFDYPGGSFTPGSDMAGTVVGLGDDARRFAVGERVIATYVPDWIDGDTLDHIRAPARKTLGGGHPGVLAEYIAISEDWLVAAPASLSDAEAACLPCAGLTAWFALIEKGGLKAGDTVLLHGTGGVSIFALQIAVAHGAHVLITSSSDEKLEKAKALGAKGLINSTRGDWVETVMEMTGGRGVDHVVETVGGAHLGRSLAAAAEGGRIAMVGVFGGVEFSGSFGDLARKHLRIEGIGVGHRRGLEDMVRAVDSAGLKPVIDGQYAFGDLKPALEHLDRGAFGKIVITV